MDSFFPSEFCVFCDFYWMESQVFFDDFSRNLRLGFVPKIGHKREATFDRTSDSEDMSF